MTDPEVETQELEPKRNGNAVKTATAAALADALADTAATAVDRSRPKDIIVVAIASLAILALVFVAVVLANCSAYKSFREYEDGRISSESTVILAAPFSKTLQNYDQSRTEQIGDDVLTTGGVTAERTSFRSDVDSTHQSRPIEVITRYPSPERAKDLSD